MKLKQTLNFMLAALALVGIVGLTTVPAVSAADLNIGNVTGEDSAVKPEGAPTGLFDNESIVTKMVNLLMYVIGTVSVIMLIFGGFKYTTSGGDASKVGEAKNTILYAIIGLVVAILAFAIVNFVTSQFTQSV